MIVVEIADGPVPTIAVARPQGYAQPVNDLARSIPGLAWDPDLKGYVGWPDAVAAFAHALVEENLAAVVGTIQDPADRLAEREGASGASALTPSRTAVRRGRSAGSSMGSIMPTALRPYQREGVEFMRLLAPEGGALLAHDVGLGKQQPIDQKVLTPTGWREIGKLAVGDKVIGSDGEPVSVTAVYPQGVKPSYRVRFSDGSSVEAGPKHLWTVLYRRAGRDWSELTVTTDQMRQGSCIDNGTGRTVDLSRAKLYLPLLSAPTRFEASVLPVPAYLLGQMIANACLAHGTPTLTVAAWDWPEIERSLQGENVSFGRARTYGSVVHVNIRETVGRIRELRLDVLSRHKRIPRLYLQALPADRIALLQGLMDGDGSVSAKQNRVVYHTTSEGLADDVRELVECLGGIASVRAYDRSEEDKPVEYQVRIRLPISISPFRIARKRDRYTPDRPGSHAVPCRVLKSIEYVRDAESVCIAVDSPDRLYATEHAILTHNTIQVLTAMRAMIEVDRLPPLAVVIGPSVTKPIWKAEAEKWHPGFFEVRVLEGTKIDNIDRDRALGPARKPLLVILNYDIAHAWAKHLSDFNIGILACDESHALLEARSRRSRAVREIRKSARAVIMLSGTPMQTRPKDLWNVIDTMANGRMGAKRAEGKDPAPDPWAFYRRYCDAKREQIARDTVVWNINGSSHEEELNLRLRWVMTRKSKADVLTDLPPRIRQTIQIQIPGAYVLPIWESGEKMRKDALSEALSMSGVGKAGASIDLASDRIVEGHSVLIFTHRRETARRIFNGAKKDKLKGVSGLVISPSHAVLITGDVAVAERTRAIKNLRELSGKNPIVIVATIDSVGVGMDISFCDVVIFNDLDWVPSKLLQCLDAQTEILTPSGFKRMGEINTGDLVAAYDRQTGRIRYVCAQNTVCRPLAHSEQMYEVRSDFTDLRVTGGHRMVYRQKIGAGHRRLSEWRITTAEEMSRFGHSYQIPVAGEVEAPGVPLTDDELRVIGWFLTDGTLTRQKKSWYFKISQSSASPYNVDIEACLRGCGMAYTITRVRAGTYSQFNRRHDQLTYNIPRFRSHKQKRKNCGWDRLGVYFDKGFPEALRGLSKSQLQILLEAIHLGDGSKQGDEGKRSRGYVRRTYHITSGNLRFVERLQHVCIERGMRANIKTGTSVFGNPRYTLNVRDLAIRSLSRAAGHTRMLPSATRSGEYVWCVENELGTLMVRRNGKTAIVGNCEGRAHRHGQKNPVLVYYLIGVGTADEYIQSKVISRLDLYERVIGGQAEAKGLKEDLEAMNTMSEADVLADLRRAVLAGEVMPEEED